MQNNIFLYKFYYQWWKNIDKSIFLIISLLFLIGLFSYKNMYRTGKKTHTKKKMRIDRKLEIPPAA